MKVVHVDYLWVDGFDTPSIRSKTKVTGLKTLDEDTQELEIGPWNFDGSSTGQALTQDSERLLIPGRLYQMSPTHYILLCEVCNVDGTPHETNYRAVLRNVLEKDQKKNMWVGFEQEYFLTSEDKNIFWPQKGEPLNTPRYYCSVGGDRIAKRNLVRSHSEICWKMGIKVVGYNAEVAPGQWEFQCFAEETLKACDDLWVSRYLMALLAETDGLGVDWSPKPHDGWNGSGCHTNFSTEMMRDGEEGEEGFTQILDKMSDIHTQSMENYGEGNKNRLVGTYETAHWATFTHGIANRGTSVRIPTGTVEAGWKGYMEDRRPASNCDPYRVMNELVKCV